MGVLLGLGLGVVASRGVAEEDAPVKSAPLGNKAAAAAGYFNREIRPILSENCFHCHGPDEETRGYGLRLDQREAAIDYGAISPGDPEASLILTMVNSPDPETVMPPPETHKKLSKKQKQALRDWIAAGAPYEKHWSFQPLPATADGERSIDDFIDAKLREQDLRPSPAASKQRWLRRVSFDLTGLPPTLEEIDAFLADDSAEAYERVVDRLLASKAYGERMATEWLDVARYSDTYGYQVDRDRFVWPWRDWVIRSFNANMPYDEFITQQLAGDLLPGATEDQVLATTFNRLHPQKVEGGSVEEEFRVEYVVDRAQTVSTAMLGLTFECARCHDHKYDPLTQREFYEMSAFFANINESGLYSYHTNSIPTPTLRLPNEKQRMGLEAAELAVEKAEAEYAEACNKAATGAGGDQAAWDFAPPIASQDFDSDAASKLPAKLAPGVKGNAAQLSGDRGISVQPASFSRWQPFSVALWLQSPDEKQRAVVFHNSRGWTDAGSRGYELLIEDGRLTASLVHFWPGNAISIRTAKPIAVGKWLHVAMTYDGSSRADGLRIIINGEPADCEVVQDQLTKTIGYGNPLPLVIGERTRDRGFSGGLVDEVQVYDRRLTSLESRTLYKKRSLETLRSPDSKASWRSDELAELRAAVGDQACREAAGKLEQARKRRDQILDAIQEIMVMRELPKPRATHVLDRGVYDARRGRVDPGVPAALPPMADDVPRNRLGLAQWLTSPENPLTARVAVNRYWQMIFGRGLVVTTEDFGSQGSPPTHPELLDWLSRRFIESGWDVHRLLKAMVLSDAYRRDSLPVDGSDQKDAENKWLARGPMAPLTAEMIRDAALAAGGLLSPKIGGPPAKPYEVAASFKPVRADRGEGLYRRSLYTYWKRTAPAPVMLVLDASTRDVCQVRRERTSSPLQAMVLLNGPQYVEAAREAAGKVLSKEAPDGDGDGERLATLFRLLTSHEPTGEQLAVVAKLHEEANATFRADPESLKRYLTVGDRKPPESLDQVELAAMTMIAQAIMNLDHCLLKR